MNKKPENGVGCISLPSSVLNSLSAASKADLALLIRLAAESAPVEVADIGGRIAESIGVSRGEAERSVYFLRGAELIATDPEGRISVRLSGDAAEKPQASPTRPKRLLSADVPQQFTSTEIRDIVDRDRELKSLFDACQQAMGKLFTTQEFNIVLSLYEYYGFASDYILLLCAHCAGKGKNLRYVEKTAHTLYDKEITTYAALTEYLTRIAEMESSEGQLRTIFGFGTRRLTPTEKEFFMHWLVDLAFSCEMIEYAYEITADRISKVSLKYTNTILESWYSAGFKTPADVKNGESGSKSETASSFNTDDFFDLALKRSYSAMGDSDKPNSNA